MSQNEFDFYDRTNLKSYNLNESMRYQLAMLDKLDVFTRKHCENVAAMTCRLCEYLHCSKGLQNIVQYVLIYMFGQIIYSSRNTSENFKTNSRRI